MKKTLAIACILCLAFATLTAFAADPVATTITTYDYTTEETEMEIITTVENVKAGDEITYYVANDEKIVYIDQATVENDKTFVEFNFVAAKGDLLTATAKNGSDQGYSLPAEFKFKALGANYMTAGNATVTLVSAAGAEMDLTGDGVADGYAFTGKLSGTPTVGYGITVKADGEEDQIFKAHGCDEEGNFVIVFEGLTAAAFESLTVAPYAE